MKKLLVLLMTLCLALPACALAEAETTATLHVVAYSEEVGQYPLAYTGELTAEALLKGLSAVTKHDFACDSAAVEGDSVTVIWSDGATLLRPESAPMRVESLDLTFYDFDSTLQFMLDSAYWTLRENLGVEKVFFATPSGAGLHLENTPYWSLPAGACYNGNFAGWYTSGYTFEDARQMMGDAGENISGAEAAQIVYAYLVAGTDNDGAVRHIALTGIGEADGAEGYVLKVEAGGSHCLTALVTYAGGVYVEKGGAFALWANWK